MTGPTLYLDDCAYNRTLGALLRTEGLAAVTPLEAGLVGADDDRHLEYAGQHGYVPLTKDTEDFPKWHAQWRAQGKRHAGIVLIYEEGNVRKDMSLHETVQSLKNLFASGVQMENEMHILNQWRSEK